MRYRPSFEDFFSQTVRTVSSRVDIKENLVFRMDADLHIINQRRKRSRSVGSVDSDAPDEYYVELKDLEDSSKNNDDGCWSQSELAKIAKISANMLNEEQVENIKKSFRGLFPNKDESEINSLCETMKSNIVKEMLKKEKMLHHKAKKERLLQKKQAALIEQEAGNTTNDTSGEESKEVSCHVPFEKERNPSASVDSCV